MPIRLNRLLYAASIIAVAAASAGEAPVSHWRFDHVDAGLVRDSGTTGQQGRLHRAATVGGGPNKAIRLDGYGFVDLGDFPDSAIRVGRRNDFSLALWTCVGERPSDEFVLLGKGDRGTNPKILLKIMSGGHVLFRIGDMETSVDCVGKTDVADRGWHHVAVAADRDKGIVLYIDGKSDGSGPSSDAIDPASDSPLFLGKSHQKGTSPRRFLRGLVDDVRLYRHALTAADVAALSRDRVHLVDETKHLAAEPEEPRVPKRLADVPPEQLAQVLDHAQGEMAGEVTATSAILQSRLTWGREKVREDVPGCPGWARFRIAKTRGMQQARETPWAEAVPESDYIVKAHVTGLEPFTRYHYQLQYGPIRTSTKDGPVRTLRTLPGANRVDSVKLVVVTGMNYAPFHHGRRGPDTAYQGDDRHLGFPALEAILKLNPDFFVGTGDNVYYDSPGGNRSARTQAQIRRKWHQQFVQPRFVRLFAQVPTYWEKDDHDFRYNDCDLTGKREPSCALGLATFAEQLPVVPPGTTNRVTYRTHRVSKHVQIWLVEGRDYRSPNAMPDGPDKTLWGKEQGQWLKNTLLASDAAFKLLISPTPMVGPDRTSKRDNHANPNGFYHEGRTFMRWLVGNGLPNRGFAIVCGDRHWQYHSVDPSGVEEFSCGALVDANAIVGTFPGDPKSNDPEGRIRQPFHPRKASGGFLMVTVGETDGATPFAEFAFFDERGKQLHKTRKHASPSSK